MSSGTTHDTRYLRAILVACSIVLALAMLIAARAPEIEAKRASATASKSKLPKITKVSPLKDVVIGTKLKLTGANFVTGKNKLIVIFKRKGSKRSFTARGTATTTKRATVVVPDVSSDLVKVDATPQDNIYKLRPITRNGAAKVWTGNAYSPRIDPDAIAKGPVNVGPSGDCDADGQTNANDSDDDNDLLPDVTELTAGTNVCKTDTDADGPTDYYEYTVAYAFNGGPVLPYPALRPYPNPLVNGDEQIDFDGDKLIMLEEYQAWQFTGLMSRFYSDADQDSDGDGRLDGAEDEDADLVPNLPELRAFSERPLYWLRRDTDGDTLCDGLDDQDHDGPPTSLAVADCTTPVPNNGPSGTPPTQLADHAPGVLVDPDPSRIDGDDNKYSNFYEWYIAGATFNNSGGATFPCLPDPYPISPYCPGPFDPVPVPGP